ncbi:esterase [Xylariaceae sp. FL0016]|nr:esterase [Xylariaceae sp. FL0016]
MVFIKPTPEYTVIPETILPGPRHGHLSTLDPAYAEVAQATEDALRPMWGGDVPMAEFKRGWVEAPPAIPEGCPEPGVDMITEEIKVPVRDGTELEVRIYRPPDGVGKADGESALCFRMHGGGWTVGSHEIEEAENRFLGALPSCVVVSVLYRLAPEFPFPYAIEDSYDVLKWCKSNAKFLRVNPERIILLGSSAGGGMAAVLAIKARDEGFTGIVAQQLMCPVTCHPKFLDLVPNKKDYELLSHVQNHNAGILDTVRMEFFWDCYVGSDPIPDVSHSPLLSIDLKGLPPAMVNVAGADPLRDEGIAFAEALKAAGNQIELHTYSGLPHSFTMFVGFKQTSQYHDHLVDFVRRHAETDENSML